MAQHNAQNERIKRQYFVYLEEAKRQSGVTVDQVAKSIARFEEHTGFRDFKAFRHEAAVAFKRRLAEQRSSATGEPLSKATLHSTLSDLRRFFHWLAGQPGYRSRLRYADAEYFNISEKDARVATARRERAAPTLEQVRHVISQMPAATDIERRDRAVVAFTLLTGARDRAVASFRLKHVDVVDLKVFQDAREVRTKNSKSFNTYFFPVGDEVLKVVVDWVRFLREELMWGGDDPLFPSTALSQGESHQFKATGLKREAWRTADPIRNIFRRAFPAAGLAYFNPHSLRKTLVHLGERLCRTPEDFKSWSQNLGHEGVLTTFSSYGAVGSRRQQEIIRGLEKRPVEGPLSVSEIAKAIALELRGPLRSEDNGLGQLRD